MENDIYSLELFKEDFQTGREIEFDYLRKTCAILSERGGSVLYYDNKRLTNPTKDVNIILETPVVDNITIKDIIEGEHYEDLSIF